MLWNFRLNARESILGEGQPHGRKFTSLPILTSINDAGAVMSGSADRGPPTRADDQLHVSSEV
jgi:hypothetical protein